MIVNTMEFMQLLQSNKMEFNLHFDGPVVPDEQVIKPISDSMSTTVGLSYDFFEKIEKLYSPFRRFKITNESQKKKLTQNPLPFRQFQRIDSQLVQHHPFSHQM